MHGPANPRSLFCSEEVPDPLKGQPGVKAGAAKMSWKITCPLLAVAKAYGGRESVLDKDTDVKF